MREAENLFVINPLVNSNLKKYVWFNKDARQKEGALAVFCQLLVMEIYIEGFATDEQEYIGEKAFNKPIVDIRKLDARNDIVFIEYENEEKLYEICHTISVVNPEVNKDEMIIFGAGKYGEEVYHQLKWRGLGEGVQFFIDSDETKFRKKKEGLEIYNIDILSETSENVSIIEASLFYKQMDAALQKMGIGQKRFYYVDEHEKHMFLNTQSDDKLQYDISYLMRWAVQVPDKNIYYYGKRDAIAEKTVRYLQLMDFHFCGFLHEGLGDARKENDYLVEDILYDENFFVLVDKYSSKRGRRKLNELGLKIGIDYTLLNNPGAFNNMDNLVLDVNLGFVFKVGEKYTGFAVYGAENENDYKIVTLGGSTTDDNAGWAKCWPRFLYEKLSLSQNVTVYNGGICAYNSGQELIKLIRDVLPLNPDLIIVYDGANDESMNLEQPFAIPYMEEIFEFARTNMDLELMDMEVSDFKIDRGINNGNSVFENWLANIEMMHALAELRGIKFFSFVQPLRYYIIQKAEKIGGWLFSDMGFWVEKSMEKYINFRSELQQRQSEKNHDYIIDLTGLLDDKPEVYIDAAHVNEEANEIIADNILNVIKRKLQTT